MADVQIWRYVVEPKNNEGWGIFLLDSTGMFCAYTDYGNYCYKWTYHGCKDFRSFVLQICHKGESDYVLGKLVGPNNKEYCAEGTLQNIKEAICEQRHQNRLTKAAARTEFDRLKEYSNLAFKEVSKSSITMPTNTYAMSGQFKTASSVRSSYRA